MYREIFVPCVLGRVPESALATSAALASAIDGRVVALAGVSLVAPIATSSVYYPAQVYATMEETAQTRVDELAGLLRKRLTRESCRWEVRSTDCVWMAPGEQSMMHARFADLVVLETGGEMPAFEAQLFSDLLVESGTPLLLVPARAAPFAQRRALIAWKGSAEASRAVHDALPLLERAEIVDLLMVEGEPTPAHRADASLILAHLQRHGVTANLVRRPHVEGGTGPVILRYAEEVGADYIVAGGYSRSRASEFAFGGVTHTLFKHGSRPVLFAH